VPLEVGRDWKIGIGRLELPMMRGIGRLEDLIRHQ